MKKLISFITILSVLMTSVVCFPLFAEAVSVPSAKLTDYCTNPDYDNIFTLRRNLTRATKIMLHTTLTMSFSKLIFPKK